MTVLRFSGPAAATAARLIIARTSLDWLQPHAIEARWVVDGQDGWLVVAYSDEWRFSSGERVLLAVLGNIADGTEFPTAALDRLDEQTAGVVREALNIATGAGV